MLTKPAGRGRARPFSGLLISKRDLLLFRAGVGKGVAQLSSVLYIIHMLATAAKHQPCLDVKGAERGLAAQHSVGGVVLVLCRQL